MEEDTESLRVPFRVMVEAESVSVSSGILDGMTVGVLG